MTGGMDPDMVREYAKEMSYALATADASMSKLKSMVDAVYSLHKNVDGKCLGCPKSLTREGMLYEKYPCVTIRVMESTL